LGTSDDVEIWGGGISTYKDVEGEPFPNEEGLDLVMSLRVSTLHKENFLTNQIKAFLDDASIKGGECNLIFNS